MATSIVAIPVPPSGDGPVVSVASLVGPKTVTLTGTFVGAYTLLASHDGATFVPVATFDSGGLEGLRVTLPDSYDSMRVRADVLSSAGVSLTVVGELGVGQNFFSPLVTFSAGASGTSLVVDLGTLFPPTGLEEGLNFICAGGLTSILLVEGSNDGASFNPIGTFSGFSSQVQGLAPALEFTPLSTPDKIRYVRVSLGRPTSSPVTVTVGGRIPASGGAGTATALYTTVGGVTVQAYGSTFMPAYADATVVGGQDNVVPPGCQNSVVMGNSNTLSPGSGSAVVHGSGNSLLGGSSSVVIQGTGNAVQSGVTNAVVQGVGNTVESGSPYAVVSGTGNTVNLISPNTVVQGVGNTVAGGASNSTILGTGNTIGAGSTENTIVGTNSDIEDSCTKCATFGDGSLIGKNATNCYAFDSTIAPVGTSASKVAAFNSQVYDTIDQATAPADTFASGSTVYRSTNVVAFKATVGTPFGDTSNIFAWNTSNVGDLNAGCHDVVALGGIQVDDGCTHVAAFDHCRFQRGTTEAFAFNSNFDFNCQRVVGLCSSFLDTAMTNTFAFNSEIFGYGGGGNVAFNCPMSASLFPSNVNCVGFNSTMLSTLTNCTAFNSTIGSDTYSSFAQVSTVGASNGYVTAFDSVVVDGCYNVVAFNTDVDSNSSDSFVVGNRTNATQYVRTVSFYSQHGSPYNDGAVAIFSTLGSSSAAPVAIWGAVGTNSNYSLAIFGSVGDASSSSIAVGRFSSVPSGMSGSQAWGTHATVSQSGEVVFAGSSSPVTLFHVVGTPDPLDLVKFDLAGAASALDSAMYLLYKNTGGTLVMNKVLVEATTGYLHVAP